MNVMELVKGDLVTLLYADASAVSKLFYNQKCEFIKMTKGGLVEIQLVSNPATRNSFARSSIAEFVELPRTFKYYNAEYENSVEAVEIQSYADDLEEVAIYAAKLWCDNEPEQATIPIAIALIDSDDNTTLFEVNCDISYDYYASIVDY